MGEIWSCRISFCLSMETGARGCAVHMAIALDAHGKMRGGAPRSNLQMAARILGIERNLSARYCAV
jgi:hypothetical protein